MSTRGFVQQRNYFKDYDINSSDMSQTFVMPQGI